MKTKVIAYSFNTERQEDKAAYAALIRARHADGFSVFKTLHTGKGLSHSEVGRVLGGCEIDLETAHLFDNQWNTAPISGISDVGLRVFDWAEDALFMADGRENKHLRHGYYLEQTEEMRQARASRVACGYCGKQYPAGGTEKFCGACIDSPYLKQSDLGLLRLVPVTAGLRGRSLDLSEAESADLLPRYLSAQIIGRTNRTEAEHARLRTRVANRISEAEKKAAQMIADAHKESEGWKWLLDRGMYSLIENVIFYGHTQRFGFGWRAKLDKAQTDALLEAISEFPFPYDIETADRGRLSGG